MAPSNWDRRIDALNSGLQNIYREDDLVIDVAASKRAMRLVPKNYGLFSWIGDYGVIYFILTGMLLLVPMGIITGIKADFGFGPVLETITAVFIVGWVAEVVSTTRQILKRNLLTPIPGNADKRKNAENSLLIAKAREWDVVQDTPIFTLGGYIGIFTVPRFGWTG